MPLSTELGRNLSPEIRDYANALVNERLADLTLKITTEVEISKLTRLDIQERISNCESMVRKLTEEINTSNSYKITKSKIIRLCQELDIR